MRKMARHLIRWRLILSTLAFGLNAGFSLAGSLPPSHSYYLSKEGDDSASGSKSSPWRSIERLNKEKLKPGDRVYFKGREIFEGSIILDSSERGNSRQPILFSSYGKGKAFIHSGNEAGLTATNSRFIRIQNLVFSGSGRKEGNRTPGINLKFCSNIFLDSIEIKGYQKAGLLIYCSSFLRATRIFTHDNGAAGIQVAGEKSKDDCYQVYIANCRAENNPGDPTQLENHSGNGILAGLCHNVIIEYCVATNNGWDMPRIGNGPVGIWAYEADSVVIQHCISFRNKTSVGGEDGGGYDLDGGVTNSFVQYCLSYENQGSAFGIFQYPGASPWSNNVYRFNISENDGLVSAARAGAYIWNGSGDPAKFSRCYFYNNVIYNTKGAALNYAKESAHNEFYFCNNIFVALDSLLKGVYDSSQFYGNDWWSLNGGFNIDGIRNLKDWANQHKKEIWKNQFTGFQTKPVFANPGRARLEDPSFLKTFDHYRILDHPFFLYNGVDLRSMLNIEPGYRDFNLRMAARNGVGASF